MEYKRHAPVFTRDKLYVYFEIKKCGYCRQHADGALYHCNTGCGSYAEEFRYRKKNGEHVKEKVAKVNILVHRPGAIDTGMITSDSHPYTCLKDHGNLICCDPDTFGCHEDCGYLHQAFVGVSTIEELVNVMQSRHFKPRSRSNSRSFQRNSNMLAGITILKKDAEIKMINNITDNKIDNKIDNKTDNKTDIKDEKKSESNEEQAKKPEGKTITYLDIVKGNLPKDNVLSDVANNIPNNVSDDVSVASSKWDPSGPNTATSWCDMDNQDPGPYDDEDGDKGNNNVETAKVSADKILKGDEYTNIVCDAIRLSKVLLDIVETLNNPLNEEKVKKINKDMSIKMMFHTNTDYYSCVLNKYKHND